MVGNLSLEKPKNEPMLNYHADEEAWKRLRKKISEIKYGETKEIPLIIGGEEISTAQTFNSIDPSDKSVIAKSSKADSVLIQKAVDTALKAKEKWASLDPKTRILLFKDLENILSTQDRKDEIIAATALECGFNALEAEGSRAEMIDFLRFNPYWYHQLIQEKPADGTGETNFFMYRPLKGFTTAITPFNFPIAIGYNLPTVMALTGNTVVWKPSSDTPLVSYLLMKALKDAGFPDGVINMVPCPGAEFGEIVLKHPELTAVNFTGSYDTAWQIMQTVYGSGPRKHFPRIVVETGGKDFMWVDKSAEPWISDVAAQMIAGAYGRSGQKCSANSRAYAPKKLLEKLLQSLTEQLSNFKTGNPAENKVHMGPVINEAAFDKIAKYIDLAKADKECEVVSGGSYDKSTGFFIQPTLIATKNKRHKLMVEEIFGPVLTIYAYESKEEEETLKALAENGYKLTGSVYCKDPVKLEKLVPRLANEAGNFYINRKTTAALVAQQPFGGDGMSGTNRKAGSPQYLQEFMSPSVVGYRHAPAPAKKK